jgi:hypothetical protein
VQEIPISKEGGRRSSRKRMHDLRGFRSIVLQFHPRRIKIQKEVAVYTIHFPILNFCLLWRVFFFQQKKNLETWGGKGNHVCMF